MAEKINLNIFTRKALEKWLDLWEQAEEIARIGGSYDDDDSDWDQDDEEPEGDAFDVCPYCGREMKMPGNQYGMCNSCHRDRQGYREDW